MLFVVVVVVVVVFVVVVVVNFTLHEYSQSCYTNHNVI